MEVVQLEHIIVTAFLMVMLIGLGVVIGVYVSSQIEKHIDKKRNGN
tara:strand:- start:1722 stop:1859 length:138 start_codon:yes stop_codon:yes gene_type:complete